MIKENSYFPEIQSLKHKSLCCSGDSPVRMKFSWIEPIEALEEDEEEGDRTTEKGRAIGAGRDAACIFRNKSQDPLAGGISLLE